MPTKLTTIAAKKLAIEGKPGDTISDTEIRGFRVRKTPTGRVAFQYRYTAPQTGKRSFKALGLLGEVTADEARALAKRHAGDVAAGHDPAAEEQHDKARTKTTVNFVIDEWLKRYARGEANLRSADATEATFNFHVRPVIGDVVLYDLTRRQTSELLDHIADNRGRIIADRVRTHLDGVLRWWRGRDDLFVTMPIVPRMSKSKARNSVRKRVLDEQELRDLFAALTVIETRNPDTIFPAFVRTLLYSGCRRDEIADMHTTEIDGDNWKIPEERYKTKIDFIVPLTAALKTRLPIRRSGYVFSNDGGKTPFSGFSKAKRALDRTINELRKREGRAAIPHWTFHDLRRTARTLMVPAGVARDVAERCIGHVLPGIEGTYNCWDYRDEKAEAFTKLATYLDRIIHGEPPTSTPDNVVKIGHARAPSVRRSS